MTLGEVIQEEKRKKRLIPTAAQLQERVVGGHEDASAMFRTNPADPGELVRLNCSNNDITPILIDVAPVTDKAFLDVRGWTLHGPWIRPSFQVRFVKNAIYHEGELVEPNDIYALNYNSWVIGSWSYCDWGSVAMWQQPRNWSMICRRYVTQLIHVNIFKEGSAYMVLLYDKSTGRHYLQQDCSYFQKIGETVKMANIFGNVAWHGEPTYDEF